MLMVISNMKLKLFSLSVLVFCTSIASTAAVNDEGSSTAVANGFVDALQHHRYRDAAAMFAPGAVEDSAAIEHTLKKIDSKVGGFSTIRPIATLPDGESIKLEVAAHGRAPVKAHHFTQLRYVSTASDGQPVYYELNLAAGGAPQQILSFGLHFPAVDTPALKRANQIVAAINR